MAKKIIAATLGNCVHVAGVMNFLRLAEVCGWQTIFLGPAVPIQAIIEAAAKEKAELVAVSYRLTPESGERLLGEFAEAADELFEKGVKFAFGGTPPLAAKARKMPLFDKVFEGGESPDVVINYLRGNTNSGQNQSIPPQETIDRIRWKKPYPILRHHFGLPNMAETVNGVRQIAEASVVDVISLGVDQDAQENFFHPERQMPVNKGAGGVPVRTADDYRKLYEASRAGNYPLMRTYSGTDDFIRMAETHRETIHNAWCAIPLFWFNRMDGRGPWDLAGSIRSHQNVMAWYASQHIPVELNEPHHWGMRDAPDVIFVVSAYLAAYNARAFGVHDYIAQYMFNSPFGTSDRMDLAKMLAVKRMIAALQSPEFRIRTQTRTGLLSYPIDPDAAMGHLAASVYLQMALQPDIVHVVGYTEADHAATAEDVIRSCRIAARSIQNAVQGSPDWSGDDQIRNRVNHLVKEADITLDSIRYLGQDQEEDPFTSPKVLAKAVTSGIMDAPQLRNNSYARGQIKTAILNGCCEAVDDHHHSISETERVKTLFDQGVENE
jgi:hypothetical protein